MAGSAIRFKRFAYNKAVEDAIRRTSKMRTALQTVTDDIASRAAASAPRLTGDYADSIRGVVEMESDGLHGRVTSDDFKAGWIEWGSEHNPAHHTLQNAVLSAGLRFQGV